MMRSEFDIYGEGPPRNRFVWFAGLVVGTGALLVGLLLFLTGVGLIGWIVWRGIQFVGLMLWG